MFAIFVFFPPLSTILMDKFKTKAHEKIIDPFCYRFVCK